MFFLATTSAARACHKNVSVSRRFSRIDSPDRRTGAPAGNVHEDFLQARLQSAKMFDPKPARCCPAGEFLGNATWLRAKYAKPMSEPQGFAARAEIHHI